LIVGLNKAFQGRAIPPLPQQLDAALAQYQAALGEVGAVLALRSGRDGAVEEAVKMLAGSSMDTAIRIELANAFGELRHLEAVDPLLRLAIGQGTGEPALQRVAIAALANYDDPRIPQQLASRLYDAISAEHNLRSTACRTLASRKAWAHVLLKEINQWRLKPGDVPGDVVQQLRAYEDPDLVAAVDKAFGVAVAVSTPEKVAEIKRLTEALADWSGDPAAGKNHYAKHCGNCHKLFGEGQTIGPPLDGYERGSLKFWLNAIIEPSLEIREGYQSYKAVTSDGRLVTGMIEAQDPNTVTFRTADTKQIVLTRNEIEGLQAIKTSLMPEKLLAELTDQQIKDLIAYLSLGAR
jgi:putative heme-binding domain-containing protein